MYTPKKSTRRGNDFPDDEAAILQAAATSNNKINLSQNIPEEYIYDPLNAEPTLDNLRSTLINQSEKEALRYNNELILEGKDNTSSRTANAKDKAVEGPDGAIKDILKAAEKDVNIHLARIKAVLAKDPNLLESYSRETDAALQERVQRLEKMQETREELQSQSMQILHSLNQNMDTMTMPANTPNKNGTSGLTQSDVQQARLAAWEKALELYMYCPPENTNTSSDGTAGTTGSITNTIKPKIDVSAKQTSLSLIQLLQHLCLTCTTDDDETLSTALDQACQMCNKHLDSTTSLLADASENTGLTYEAYAINLMAHSLAAQSILKRTENIQNQYLLHGREALRIGSALEMAEAKRRQSDNASELIRRWWMMENLANQEEMSGEEIRVHEEVRGDIPSSTCRMEPLFTRPENSLEAARTLKNLRMVVRCRSASNASNNDKSGSLDPQASKRFELTDKLIQRTSAALEQRLLNTFSDIYTEGGSYDFSSVKASVRPGRLDWLALREVSEALMNFDSGKSLHKKYVNLVVSTKFPEFFHGESLLSGNDVEEKEGFNVDDTRRKLSSLFHRICEVCSLEFKLTAHMFSPTLPPHLQEAIIANNGKPNNPTSFTEMFPLQVSRSLLQQIISDRYSGLQAQINDLLESIDQKGDSDSGAQKLDMFVVIHEKASGLFSQLKEAAQAMWGATMPQYGNRNDVKRRSGETLASYTSNTQAIASLTQYLTSQEKNLSSGQRRGYLNLELRLLHHSCCEYLHRNSGKLLPPVKSKEDGHRGITGFGGLADYRAPIVALDKKDIKESGFGALLKGPLKASVAREPLVKATNALARARLMFGSGSGGGEIVDSTARVVITIFTQMCNFYGPSYLHPIVESLGEMLVSHPPNSPPVLPFDESKKAHDLGVDGKFWVAIERVHTAAKSFDRELWAENRTGSMRVWEILVQTRSQTSLTLAKDRRIRFFHELEERGEAVILRALDTLSAHIQWIFVTGGESVSKTKSNTGNRLFAGGGKGPYAVPSGSILDSTNSSAVKALTFCLRSQFVHIQAALTPQSLSKFWTALSKRLFDIIVTRLLQNYTVSTVGAVVLSRDVEGLRSVSMLAGTDHSHWDTLRELLTLYMTPPDSLKAMLIGAEGDPNSGKGMFGRVGKDQSIVFMSRRNDYRYKTNQGMKKSQWVVDLLEELNFQQDPTDGRINISLYTSANISIKN